MVSCRSRTSALVLIVMLVLPACGWVPRTNTVPVPAITTPKVVHQPPRTPARPTITSGLESIEPGNASRLTEMGRLGKGAVWAPEGEPGISADGGWMAIPTLNGIYIYDAGSLAELRMIPVGTAFIAFSPGGDILAASEREVISLWDPATGHPVGELPGGLDVVYWDLSFSPDGLLLSAVRWDRQIAVWSVTGHELLFACPGDRLHFSPDGDLAVVVIFGENRVHLYDTHSWVEVNQWDVHDAGFTPGGQLWLEDDGSVRLAEVDRDLMSAPFKGVQPSFSADGLRMAVFADGQILLYEHLQGRRTQALEGSYVRVDDLAFSPDGATLAGDVYSLRCPACSELDGLDRQLVLWRASDGAELARIAHPSGWLAYTADGRRVVALQGEYLQVVRARDGKVETQKAGFYAPVAGMALSSDGVILAMANATDPYTLRLWDLESGQVIDTLHNPQAPNLSFVEAAFSSSGEYLAVGGDLWDLGSTERLTGVERSISGKTSCWSVGVDFSPVEATLATGCFEGRLDLWRVPGGELLKSMDGHEGWVSGLAFSGDGTRLAAIYGVPDYLVQVWELPNGTPAFALTGGHFTSVSYSPDGSTLATVAATGEHEQYGWMAGIVQLWDGSSGEEIARVGVEDAVSIAFSPGGTILATGSLDGTLRLWEIPGGGQLAEISGHNEQIQHLEFSPEGTRLFSGSMDGTIAIWGIQ